MRFVVSTWNINSVRLRLPLVKRFLQKHAPDVLCLQETKCPDDKFPHKEFEKIGYPHVAIYGQKGYHGVATISRLPIESSQKENFCKKEDCRHLAVDFGKQAGLKKPLAIHNFYVPAGGDEPDPNINVKFAHKLSFLDELAAHAISRDAKAGARSILVGDLNVAPLEHDVWSHKQMLRVVSHTPVEVEKFEAFRRSGGWIDNMGRNHNANETKTSGGRLALRWQPDADWTIDLASVLQDVNSSDSQYVTASDNTVRREARIAEPTDNDFKSVAATVQGPIGALKLLATTIYVDHGVHYTLDASDASAQFGLSGQSTYLDDRKYSILNHELRISPASSSNWIAGLSYMRARSHNVGTMSSASETLAVETLDRKITEFAAFGEVTIPLINRVTATAGIRIFRSIAEDEALEQSGATSEHISKTGVSPSLALAWAPGTRSIVYLR